MKGSTIQDFQLQPFDDGADPPSVAISGHLLGTRQQLALHVSLQGDLNDLLLPAAAADPARRDQLWTSTCFECFLAVAGGEPYWEFNLSPAGHWNVYRLTGYRRGLEADLTVTSLDLRIRQSSNGLQLDLHRFLPVDLIAAPALAVGISAVIQQRSGRLSYWALSHPGPEADFHRREGFLLRL